MIAPFDAHKHQDQAYIRHDSESSWWLLIWGSIDQERWE